MTSNTSTTENSRPSSGKRTLQTLRREAGYTSAKEFAKKLGIPAPTYARYERQPESPDTKIPMGAAWKIADALGCSIDVVVGRYETDDEGSRVQRLYNKLSEPSRQRLEEYLDFIEYREHVMAAQRRWE